MQKVSRLTMSAVWGRWASGCHLMPKFSLGFSGKMGCGPFHWAMNHCVFPVGNCRAKKCVPQEMSGGARHAKGFEMSLVWRCCLQNIGPAGLIMSFLAKFFTWIFRKNGPRSFLLRREPLCRPPGELLRKQTSSTKAERHPKSCKRHKDQRVTKLEMSSSQHWSHRLHNVIVAPFQLVFLLEKCAAGLSTGPRTIVSSPT